MKKPLAVVIMAAGKGTRMKNPDIAKVMHTIADRPMVEHVADLALELQSSRTVVIVGWQKLSVIDHLRKAGKPVVCVEQTPQLGTGHAVMQAEGELDGFEGDVLVLSGDVPLLGTETIRRLIAHHHSSSAAATVLTAILDDPAGYGRILRDSRHGQDGNVVGIVEHKDASEEQRGIREVNTGIYVFEKGALFQGLRHITPHNVQKEYYLTDVFQYFWRNHLPVSAVPVENPREIQGINTVEQLEEARRVFSEGWES